MNKKYSETEYMVNLYCSADLMPKAIADKARKIVRNWKKQNNVKKLTNLNIPTSPKAMDEISKEFVKANQHLIK